VGLSIFFVGKNEFKSPPGVSFSVHHFAVHRYPLSYELVDRQEQIRIYAPVGYLSTSGILNKVQFSNGGKIEIYSRPHL